MSKVKCVDAMCFSSITVGKVYELLEGKSAQLCIENDIGNCMGYPAECFEPVEERAKAPTPETPMPAVPSIEHMATFLAASDIDKELEWLLKGILSQLADLYQRTRDQAAGLAEHETEHPYLSKHGPPIVDEEGGK